MRRGAAGRRRGRGRRTHLLPSRGRHAVAAIAFRCLCCYSFNNSYCTVSCSARPRGGGCSWCICEVDNAPPECSQCRQHTKGSLPIHVEATRRVKQNIVTKIFIHPESESLGQRGLVWGRDNAQDADSPPPQHEATEEEEEEEEEEEDEEEEKGQWEMEEEEDQGEEDDDKEDEDKKGGTESGKG
ncbi:hypothetical protein E2C01_056622 [Portunus trituberculatus]|uniref:Uncharacterized protein n=1 Tax=Portunus trituberculatus TaxID=210409 RepID=A0A5B7GY84_PORTR|nr:hypothetical protein [Portunus trituberculatus]